MIFLYKNLDKGVRHNILYSFISKIFTILLPLIVFPYLLIKLGKNDYGIFVYILTLSNFFVFFIKFGFDSHCARLIAIEKNVEVINKIFFNVLYLKIILYLISIVFFHLLNIFFFQISQTYLIYIFVIMMSEAINIYFFFIGIEKLKFVSILTALNKLVFGLLVLINFNNISLHFVLLSYACTCLLGSIFSFLIVNKFIKLNFVKFEILFSINILRDSVFLYFSNSLSTFKDLFTVYIINKYLGVGDLALYDIINRIVSLLITPFHIINTVYLPKFSQKFSLIKLKKVLLIFLFLSLLVVVVFLLFKNWIFYYLKLELNINNSSFYYMMISSVPFLALSSCTGTLGLIAVGENNKILLSTFFSISIYILFLLSSFYFFPSLLLVSISLLISVVFEFLIRYYLLGKYNGY